MSKRTLEQWRAFVRMRHHGESEPTRDPQGRVIGLNEFKATVPVIEKIQDDVTREKVRSLFSAWTKYEALDMVLSKHYLGFTHPDLAVEIAEAAAGADYEAQGIP